MRIITYLLFFCSLLFVSCQFGLNNKERGASNRNITVFRYDKLLNEYVEFNSFSAWQKMNSEHFQATKYLIEDVLRLGQVNDDNINGKLKTFYSDSTLHILMKDVEVKYKDLDGVEKVLSSGFKRLKKEVPTIKIPYVYSQISALNESVVVGDSILGISLDKYMGEDYPLYKRYFYDYQCKSMKPQRIAPDCFTFFLVSEYPFPSDSNHALIDAMLHNAKIGYVVSKILNYSSLDQDLDYSSQEAEWCKQNMKNVWEYMIQNNNLYSTDPMLIRKYTKPAPYTAFFGEGSPAMVGSWIGLQIIDSYMKNHKNTSLRQLLEMTDYRKILAESNFKP